MESPQFVGRSPEVFVPAVNEQAVFERVRRVAAAAARAHGAVLVADVAPARGARRARRAGQLAPFRRLQN